MKLKELLCFDDIVIQCHNNPDADAIASGFALLKYLEFNGKKPRLIYSGNTRIEKPNLVLMIEKLDIPIKYAEYVQKPELIVTVDCLFGERNVQSFEAYNFAAIDHHNVTAPKGTMAEIRSNYGSCSSIIADMYIKEGLDYNDYPDVATALYYGLYMDTNGFSEVSQAPDRDLRDNAVYDSILIQLLKNTNLSLAELNMAGDALNNVIYNSDYKFAITEAKADSYISDPNILGFISDLVLQTEGVDICLVYGKTTSNQMRLSVRSCTNIMSAKEIAAAVTNGNGGGHLQKAGGSFDVSLAGGEAVNDYIISKIIETFDKYEILNSDNIDISVLPLSEYRKLPQVMKYTRSTDILPAGNRICVRTLEADFNIESSDSIYLMISKSGSVYPITKEKFDRTYSLCDSDFIFDGEYEPRVFTLKDGEMISQQKNLLDFAHTCISKQDSNILAAELNRCVKLYTKWDKNNYMNGEIGDFIAVRKDDNTDVYIIKRSQFEAIYEKV